MNIDILLDSNASPSEVAAVEAIVREEGLHGSIEAGWSSRGLEQDPWVIFLLFPIGIFVKGFLTDAGKDAYQGIRRLTSRLFGARRNSNGCVEVWDDHTSTHIILTSNLPEEAYTQLAQIGLEQLRGGYWTWDSDSKEWTRL